MLSLFPAQPALVGHTGVKLMLDAEPLASAGGANYVFASPVSSSYSEYCSLLKGLLSGVFFIIKVVLFNCVILATSARRALA